MVWKVFSTFFPKQITKTSLLLSILFLTCLSTKFLLASEKISETYTEAKSFYLQRNYTSSLSLFLKLTQSADDSLKAKACNGVGLSYLNLKAYDSAIYYLEQSFDIRRSMADSAGMANTLLNMGNVYLRKGWYQVAARKYQNTLDDYEQQLSNHRKASLYNNLSLSLMYQANYSKAFEVLTKALDLARESGQKSTIANCWMNMGNVYEKLPNVQMAIIAYDSAKTIYDQIGDSVSMMQAWYNHVKIRATNKGNINYTLKQYDSIEQFLIKKNVQSSLFKLYNARADLLNEIGNLQASIAYRYKAIHLPNVLDDENALAKIQLAHTLLIEKQPTKAEELLEEVKEQIYQSDNLKLLCDYYEAQMYLSQNKKLTDSILKYTRKYFQSKLQLTELSAEEKFRELVTDRQLDLREQQLIKLTAKNEFIQQENLRMQQLTLLLVISIILALLALLAGWSSFRKQLFINRQKQKIVQTELKAIEAEKKKLETDLELKIRENITETIRLADRNQLVNTIKVKLEQLNRSKHLDESQQKLLTDLLNEMKHLPFEKAMKAFEVQYNQVNPHFKEKLLHSHDKLTEYDIILASSLALGMNNPQLADLLQINTESLRKAKYRLKRKLKLDPETDLSNYLKLLNNK